MQEKARSTFINQPNKNREVQGRAPRTASARLCLPFTGIATCDRVEGSFEASSPARHTLKDDASGTLPITTNSTQQHSTQRTALHTTPHPSTALTNKVNELGLVHHLLRQPLDPRRHSGAPQHVLHARGWKALVDFLHRLFEAAPHARTHANTVT